MEKSRRTIFGVFLFIALAIFIRIPSEGYIELDCNSISDIEFETGSVGKHKTQMVYKIKIVENNETIYINSKDEMKLLPIYHSLKRCSDTIRVDFQKGNRTIFFEKVYFI